MYFVLLRPEINEYYYYYYMPTNGDSEPDESLINSPTSPNYQKQTVQISQEFRVNPTYVNNRNPYKSPGADASISVADVSGRKHV